MIAAGRPYLPTGADTVRSLLSGEMLEVAAGNSHRFSNQLLSAAIAEFGLTEKPFSVPSMRPLNLSMLGLQYDNETESQKWLAQAQDEHASVAAFAMVQLELLAHGAPLDLVSRTLTASQEELDHVSFCKALAGVRAHFALPAHELRAQLQEDWPELLSRSLHQGAVPEANAAMRLFRDAYNELEAGRHDRARILWTMGQDEARHAELAFDIALWAASRCGAESPRLQIGPDGVTVAAWHDCASVATA